MNETEQTPAMGTKQYYVLGLIVLVAVAVAGYLLKSKSTVTPTSEPVAQEVVATPTPGPISGLGCDAIYYNPVVGFPKYYVSVEGGDLSTAKKIDCTFTLSVDNKIVATTNASSPLTETPQRGGSTFRCSTAGIELTPGVETIVDVAVKDDLKASSTCSSTLIFPAP